MSSKTINIERMPNWFGIEFLERKREDATMNWQWLAMLCIEILAITLMVIIGMIMVPLLNLWNFASWLMESRKKA